MDLTKVYHSYYKAKQVVEQVAIEKAGYISITGKGDPSGPAFAGKIEALYSVAYTIKFICKANKHDFVVPKLEGLWWFEGSKLISMAAAPLLIPRSEWQYRLMLRMPEFVTADMIASAIRNASQKKQLPTITEVTPFTLPAHESIQILHVGPFEQEPDSLIKLDEFMKQHNLRHAGDHHEIYLSDFRKTPAEKLKTILREPVC